MIIGLKNRGKEKAHVYQEVDTFINRFKERFRGVNCRELLGVDLKTEEGLAYLKNEGRIKCGEFVRFVADKLGELMVGDK